MFLKGYEQIFSQAAFLFSEHFANEPSQKTK